MTKAENRAAAKAWHAERMQRLAEQIHADAVKAELPELARLRDFLIKGKRPGDARRLIEAIDDYVEQITGDRTTLHAKNHRCG